MSEENGLSGFLSVMIACSMLMTMTRMRSPSNYSSMAAAGAATAET